MNLSGMNNARKQVSDMTLDYGTAMQCTQFERPRLRFQWSRHARVWSRCLTSQ